MRKGRRSPRWARLFVWFGVALMVLSGASIAAANTLIHRYEGAVHQVNLLPGSAPRQDVIQGAFTYLLLGSDKRPSDTSGAAGRSDTIMLVHVSADHKHAYLVSIPRDLWVPIDDCGQGGSCTAKINAAYDYGGPALTARTVTQLTGVRLDGMAIINFQGFDKIVDALGGITMCVDEPTRSIHTGRLFTVGCHHFTGREALDYVRQREDLPHGDYDRQRHQQQLIKAAAAKVEGSGLLGDPIGLDKVIRLVGDDLTVDTNGVPLSDLVFSLRKIRSDDITMLRLPEIDGTSDDGQSIQLLDDVGRGLFAAVRADDLGAWAVQHPALVNRNG
ncbi:MAG TPA: LCP family protein [Actinocatenispora sp.]